VALVDAGVGDTVLVHAKEAIAVSGSDGGSVERAARPGAFGIERRAPRGPGKAAGRRHAVAFTRSCTPTRDRASTRCWRRCRRSTADKATEIVTLRDQVALKVRRPARRVCHRDGQGVRRGRTAVQLRQWWQQHRRSNQSRPIPAAGNRPSAAGVSLAADIAAITAPSNDVGFEVVFARQLPRSRARRHRFRLVDQRRVGKRTARIR